MSKWFTQLTARFMLLVMTCIFVSPSFAQSLVQTHAQLEHRHTDGSNTALEQHLLESALSDDHHDADHDADHDDDEVDHDQVQLLIDGDHHGSIKHQHKDANGNDLPPHNHDNAHNFIGHVLGHMPVLFSIGFSFHFPPLSQLTQVQLETHPPFVIQDAPFRPPRTFLI